MSPHLAIGGLFYLTSLTPWMVLNLKLRGSWSAFRIFALWSLIRVAMLCPLVWVDFEAYSRLAWPCRAVTIALLGFVLGELWDEDDRLLGGAVGITIATFMLTGLLTGGESVAYLYRVAGGGAAICCALAIWKCPESRPLATGLLVLTLFPAISEFPSVLEFGGWLRFVPTVSAWVALTIWLTSESKIRGMAA